LGLAVSDDSVQIKESEALLVTARGKGFLDARILRGSSDMYIEESTASHSLSRTAV
jgi:hypothetical protein